MIFRLNRIHSHYGRIEYFRIVYEVFLSAPVVFLVCMERCTSVPHTSPRLVAA